ncbi:MAG: universal stress protein [Deltaproteobacteria bacterium]|nr:universal stress protein [Deltaproteobacteria bacterium]
MHARPEPELRGAPSPVVSGLRSLVVALDLSPLSDRLVARVALLPFAEGARLTLLHAVPESLPSPARRRAARDARDALEAEAEQFARTLPAHVALHCAVETGAASVEIARCAASVGADMLVIGRGGGRALRDLFLGSTAERVLRRGRLPVLVVRLPARTPYRYPMLALDFDQAAHHALDLVLRVVPPPRPPVEVIHAYEVPYMGLRYASLADDDTREDREVSRRHEREELHAFLAAALVQAGIAPADAPAWRVHVLQGAPRTVIERAVEKARPDLLVLGTRGHGGVANAFLGTVAGDVLREVTCDVLVVPPRRTPPEADAM